MRIQAAFKSCDPTELIPAWLDQGKPDWTEVPDDEVELAVGLASIEMALSLLIDLAGGIDWIKRHPSVSESIPPDVLHNASGWLAARAQQDLFRFTYRGWRIGLADVDIQSLLDNASPGHFSSIFPDLPEEVEENDSGGGGYAH